MDSRSRSHRRAAVRVKAPLHLVTDDAVLRRPDFVALATETMQAGGPALVFHVRGPATTGARLLELTKELVQMAEAAGVALVVNDRLDVAMALGIGWVHLGQRSLPPLEARRLLGPEAAVVGVSVHGPEEAAVAEEGRADYLMVGTMFATPTHSDAVPTGPGLLGMVSRVAAVPLVAIGGITPERVGAVVEGGASAVAVVSGVWESARPERAVEIYLGALSGASGVAMLDGGA